MVNEMGHAMGNEQPAHDPCGGGGGGGGGAVA
jgi:hypothetical protein